MYEIMPETGDRLLVLKAVETLTGADFEVLRPAVDRLLGQASGPIRVLLDWTELKGWDAGGETGSFQLWAHEWADVERLAIVAPDRFIENGLQIAKILSRAEVRHFQPGQTAEARSWLDR
jgi:hypothetical protein